MGKFLSSLDESKILQGIRQSLVAIIPILLVGSFALIIKNLPIKQYQIFIINYYDGFLLHILDTVYNSTIGVISVYICVSLAINGEYNIDNKNYILVFISLITFFMFSGAFDFDKFNINVLGEDGVFVAILCTIFASKLYMFINKKIKHRFRFYFAGADEIYTQMLYSMPAMIIVSIVDVFIYFFIVKAFNVNSLQEIKELTFSNIMNAGNANSLIYIMLVELQMVFWFLGFRGLDIVKLKNIGESLPFVITGIDKMDNIGMFDLSFIHTFVFMGGCGTTICLALAILFFGRKKTSKRLIALSGIPLLFNVNELIVYGLPIVLNPVYFIPFMTVPMVCTITSIMAMHLGLVPLITTSIKWTTPIFINAYMATGSIAGVFLQIINIALGVLIYAPFVIYSEKRSIDIEKRYIYQLTGFVRETENLREEIKLLGLKDKYGVIARSIADEIKYKIDNQDIKIKYQPQFNNKNKCIGVECLLDWEYSNYGKIYTPLVMNLAKEMNYYIELEKVIFITVFNNMDKLISVLGQDGKISINLTGKSIQTKDFEEFLYELANKYSNYINNVVIEITEQDSIDVEDRNLIDRIEKLRRLGYRFAIDDFSMGSTSIKYLKYNIFDLVKIDGALSRDVIKNENSRSIVGSITGLTRKINVDILAEYVEYKEQKDILESIGCFEYQGYYYSASVDIDELGKVIDLVKTKLDNVSA